MRGKVVVPVFLALLLLLTLAPGGPWGRERVLFALFVELALLAVAAPLGAGGKDFLALPIAGAVAVGILSLFCAPGTVGSVLLAHLVLGVFAGFLRGLAILIARPRGPRAAALIASLLGLALLVSPLAMDFVLPLSGPERIRGNVLHVALVLNPPAAISQSLFGVDWIREGSLYDRARFPSSRPFAYPPWTASLAAFAFLWAAVAGAASLRRTRPSGGEVRQDGRSRPSTA